jgi:hypothetical protein
METFLVLNLIPLNKYLDKYHLVEIQDFLFIKKSKIKTKISIILLNTDPTEIIRKEHEE